jgi:sugar transferase EpsL
MKKSLAPEIRASELKRLLDTVSALLLLILCTPLMLLTALAVRIGMGSPVLIRQTRPGLNARPFAFLKFRSMTEARNEAGELLPDAERMTPFGAWLRRSSLDELPQLFNVLKGDMSLVGPRPLLMEYLPLYTPRQAMRHRVRPGITGWAQVNGRNAISWESRFELDVWYVENRSLLLDLKILLLTGARLFRRGDVSHAGHVTMPRFTGSTRD